MVEVSKPDYLSLVNKGGSGFNVSELVTSIVAAEIEPKRALQTEKKQTTENAISGIGYLNSQTSYTKSAFGSRANDTYFSLSSSNSAAITITSKDETKLANGIKSFSDVTIAKSMVYELPGFSLSDTFTETLTIDLGTWSRASTASNSTISHPTQLEEGKTYKILRADGNGDTFDQHTRDPHDPSSTAQHMFPTDGVSNPKLSVGAYFRAGAAISDANYDFQEVDNYTFTQKAGTSTVTINSNNDTLTIQQMVTQINAVAGITAKLVQKSEGSSEYSVIIASDTTGNDNGFKIKSSLTGDAGQRWQTSLFTGTATANQNLLTQSAKDAEFKLDGVSFSRSQNVITDLIDGAELTLNADVSSATQISVARSESATKDSVQEIINSLNEFKAEIDRLTYIDIEGDENGPLAMDPAVTRVKSNFKKIAVEPLSGYGANNIYLAQLGIKTNTDGEFYFDEVTFNKTWAANPEYFNALKDDNISSSVATSTVTKSQFTSIPANKYLVQNDSGQWKFGDTNLNRVDYDSGSRFTSTTYAGLVIDTVARTPDSFYVYIGKSFSEKISDFMQSILDLNSAVVEAETAYRAKYTDMELKLADLDEREKLLTTRYTTQFGAMEQSMSQFNSTKSMLENFVEAWKKQK